MGEHAFQPYGGSAVCVQVIVVVVGMKQRRRVCVLSLKQTATHNKADPAFRNAFYTTTNLVTNFAMYDFKHNEHEVSHQRDKNTIIASDHGRPVASHNLNPTVRSDGVNTPLM